MPHKHLTISSDLGQLKTVREAVLELATPCLSGQAHMVVLAVDEAVSNVMRHGHGSQAGTTPESIRGTAPGEGAIDVDIRATSGRFEICIADSGPAYNPCEAKTEDLAERVLARKRGGMGISIIRRVMDEVHYARSAGRRNELRLIKYIVPKS